MVPAIAFSQRSNAYLDNLYRFVEHADSLSMRSFKTFYLEKFSSDRDYRETWRYSSQNGRVYYFQIDYIIDSSEFTEVYYLDRGNLVCSEEYEKVNYSLFDDDLQFGGVYFYQSSVPRHIVMLGKRKSVGYRDDPSIAALSRFEKRYSELRRHLPMLPY